MQRTDKHTISCFHEPSIGTWEDDVFEVAGFLDQNTIRLDIWRKDMKDGIGWDELHTIKSKCGFADFDAVEFYPRDCDVLNTANIRHLYLFSTLLPQIRRGYTWKKEAQNG
jgi:hypothetical protein